MAYVGNGVTLFNRGYAVLWRLGIEIASKRENLDAIRCSLFNSLYIYGCGLYSDHNDWHSWV